MFGFRHISLCAILAALSSASFAANSHAPRPEPVVAPKPSSQTKSATTKKENDVNAIVDEYLSDSAEQSLDRVEDEDQKKAVQKAAYLLDEKLKNKGDPDWKDFVSAEMEMSEKELKLALDFISKEYDKDGEDHNLFNLKGLLEDELMAAQEKRIAEEQRRADEAQAVLTAFKEQRDKLGQIAANASSAFNNLTPAGQAVAAVTSGMAANAVLPGSGALISSLMMPTSLKPTESTPSSPSSTSSPTHASSTSSQSNSSQPSETPSSAPSSTPTAETPSTSSTPSSASSTSSSTSTSTPSGTTASTPSAASQSATSTASNTSTTPSTTSASKPSTPASTSPAIADNRSISNNDPQISKPTSGNTNSGSSGPTKTTPPSIQPPTSTASKQPNSDPAVNAATNVAGTPTTGPSSWSPKSFGEILNDSMESASNSVASVFETLTTNTRRHASNGSRESASEANGNEYSTAIEGGSNGSNGNGASGSRLANSNSRADEGANRVGRADSSIASTGPVGPPQIYSANPNGSADSSDNSGNGSNSRAEDDVYTQDDMGFANYGASPGTPTRAGKTPAPTAILDPTVYTAQSTDVGARSPEKSIAYVDGDANFIGPTQTSSRGISADSSQSSPRGDSGGLYAEASGPDSTFTDFERTLENLNLGRGFGADSYSGLGKPTAERASAERTGEYPNSDEFEESLAYSSVYNGEPYVAADGEVVHKDLLESARGLVKKKASGKGLVSLSMIDPAATKPQSKKKTDLGGFYATASSTRL